VPDVSSGGLSYDDAKDQLDGAGFSNVTQVCGEAEPGDPPGSLDTVVAQDPTAGSVVNKNTQIKLTVRKMHCP
jgi:beta-lactam-binding protein with PASTA domain